MSTCTHLRSIFKVLCPQSRELQVGSSGLPGATGKLKANQAMTVNLDRVMFWLCERQGGREQLLLGTTEAAIEPEE
jgi:hypothetical protein